MVATIEAFRGQIITADDPGYDAARSVWNGMIDKRPALIAHCLDTADVVAAVKHAAAAGLGVAIRGGGHNAAGLAVADGALVIDLTRMRNVTVDPVSRTARAEGGANWGDFDRATAAHGLGTTGGAISSTGIGGLTLGGGLGWLMRSYGLACDNMIAAELVTADGSVVHASDTENPELLWGLRGGGGNFGVVTSFTFKLHPVSTVLAGLLVHPIERAREALHFYRDFTASAPDAVTAFATLTSSPEGMPIFAFLACYNGPTAEGEIALKPLREFGPPLADEIAEMPYTTLQTTLDNEFPHGLPVYWRSHFAPSLNDDLIDILATEFATVASPLSQILIENAGGAVSRIDPEATAFDHRHSPYNLAFISRWTDPAAADRNIEWTRKAWSAAEPHARGVYVNYLGVGENQDRVRAAYGSAKYDRLSALKRQYDPTNLFRFNQNITPK